MRVELTPKETIVEASDEELASLRTEFMQHHFVRLPGLIGRDLARSLCEWVDAGGFFEREEVGIARELSANDGRSIGLLTLMLNDERLRSFVGSMVVQTPTVWSGRIYRFAEGGFYDDWHDDSSHGRFAAISINISPEPFEGCLLQIREIGSGTLLAEVDNTNLGDAILFRIDPKIEHRNTPLVGTRPKTACAGFFRTGERLAEYIERRRLASAD